ncbi:ankyrin repeat domain-containing protein 27 isoform X2 [Aplysia californica]|nr:ankyrin repeat domain-containing protein 27 isoform X2 [Aplysia californica]
MTTHSSSKKTVKMNDDGQVLITLQGFPEELSVKILSEELAYNKDYKQYKILILERPLNSKFQVTSAQREEKKTKELQTPKISVAECTAFLKSFSEFKTALEQLDKNIEYFCRHYMILPDYLDDARARLEDISAASLRKMSLCLRQPLASDIKFIEVLAGAIESYLMSLVYKKVFPVISQHLSKEDQTLLSKGQKLNRVKPEQIGVRREFSCPLPMAVVELANLGNLLTPREKLTCLKSTVDNITEGITQSIKGSRQEQLAGITTEEDEPCITSDDLIPILVMVIAQAKCCHLHSDLFYMEHFIWESMDKDRDDLSYCLVTFKAAVQYMMTTDFSHLEDKRKNDPQKEISIEDLMAATSVSESTSHTGRGSPRNNASAGRLERQLNRISGILEQNAQEMGAQRQQQNSKRQIQSIFTGRTTRLPPPEPLPTQRNSQNTGENNQLGDFLSALQDDDFDLAFGKQK